MIRPVQSQFTTNAVNFDLGGTRFTAHEIDGLQVRDCLSRLRVHAPFTERAKPEGWSLLGVDGLLVPNHEGLAALAEIAYRNSGLLALLEQIRRAELHDGESFPTPLVSVAVGSSALYGFTQYELVGIGSHGNVTSNVSRELYQGHYAAFHGIEHA